MGYTQLTEIERYQIQVLLKANFSKSAIARELNRHPATIGREIARNSGLRGYRPGQAQRFAEERRQRHSRTLIQGHTWMLIETLLRMEWSPEQISGWLKKEKMQSASPEWIYQHILNDKDQGGDLYRFLRCQKKRKKRYGKPDARGQIKGRVSIDERPAQVEKRMRIGDWEVDTMIGQQGGAVLVTLAERKTRFSILARSKDKSASAVKKALIQSLKPLTPYVKTLTYDNGKEFAFHAEVSEQLNAKGYFAHPYHSWERGLNENMNGLIRQYAPKGANFDLLSDKDIKHIMDRLNNRPRKCLGYKTPNEVFFGIKPKIALAS